MVASIALERGGKGLLRRREPERSRHRFVPVADDSHMLVAKYPLIRRMIWSCELIRHEHPSPPLFRRSVAGDNSLLAVLKSYSRPAELSRSTRQGATTSLPAEL